ncbi:hypothetical protein D3C76_1032930 [compost metagenome]
MVAHAQGKAHHDTAAGGRTRDETAKVEHHRITVPTGNRYHRTIVGIAIADLPLADLVADTPGDARDVEQGQRQVGREFEVFVVTGNQVIAELEGYLIAWAQFAIARWWLIVDVQYLDVHGARGHGAEGRGVVSLRAAGEVQYVLQKGAFDHSAVTDVVAFVDLAMGRTRRWLVGLPDHGGVAQYRQCGSL